MLTIDSILTLNNAVELPLFGFGSYKIDNENKGLAALLSALETGYRHIDTASIYQNEALVGNAITQSGLERKELFITTKLWLDEQGTSETPAALERSLQKLQTDYVDLYLMHWPHPESDRMLPCWDAMQALLKSGKCRAIGVSNFSIRRLRELFELSDFRPAVNQVEFNVFNYKRELAEFCCGHDIVLQSYSPLARCQKDDHPQLQSIASKYGKTPAQIMLRWCLQHKTPVIPKSSNTQRIQENADLFDFEIEVAEMAALDQLNENLEIYSWTPDPQNWY